MMSAWPEYTRRLGFHRGGRAAVEMIKEAVRAIRNVRTSMNVPPSKKAHVYVVSDKEEVRDAFTSTVRYFFASLGYASDVHDSGR